MHTKLLLALVLVALPLGCTHATEDVTENEAGIRSPGKPLHPLQVKVIGEGKLQAGVAREAEITVRSNREIDLLEVSVEAPADLALEEDSFQRYRPDFVHGETTMPFRFRPAADGVQQVKIHLRATDSSGRVMSRTVDVLLGDDDGARQDKRNRAIHAPTETLESSDDVVVKGEQEVRREN